ncbi:4-hydroxy-tetrahydrodipicolinate synthase 2, chloroplastic-like [Silene latifolia]|uniref:4-hydroxy-tetrahydrodipicolinate synthase 2, chloroplastic-like n=1 Tax=Silene latifolia TaxID=37657 RepID=UPI003D77A97E
MNTRWTHRILPLYIYIGTLDYEGQLMSWDEHIMLIGHTVNCFGTNIKVIGNTGSNSTREAIHATEQGFAVGMHAALHINPYYGKTSMEGLIAHFQSVLPMGPTIIYNVPSRTSQDIPPHAIHLLEDFPNLAGVKECVGNERIKEYTDNDIVVWSGNDDECHDSRWSYGATGVISVTSNLVPKLMRRLMFEDKNPSLRPYPEADVLERMPSYESLRFLHMSTFVNVEVPQQKTCYDCGAHVLKFLSALDDNSLWTIPDYFEDLLNCSFISHIDVKFHNTIF